MTFIEQFLQNGTIVSLQDNLFLVGWGTRQWGIENKAFYFPDFFLEARNPWFSHQETTVMSVEELIKALSPYCNKSSEKWHWSYPNFELYSSIYKDLKERCLQTGVLYKGVPFAKSETTVRMSPMRIAKILISLLQHSLLQNTEENSLCFPYGFWDHRHGILGATPEILFRKKNGSEIIKTVACAGTCGHNEEVSEFLADAKACLEHQYVIDGIKDSLSEFGEISQHSIRVIKFPHLKHLYTPMTLKPTRPVNFYELVKALHPTPALGAYPKEAGKLWLKELQKKIDRQRFGAPVGYVQKNGQFACYVGIRNVQWSEDRASIFAGGGVVLKSELKKEWNEIILKFKAIKKVLALETPF